MRSACFWIGAIISLGCAAPAAAQLVTIPPGAYRTAADYHRHQPRPAGFDAFFPDKRGQVVVVVPRGATREKVHFAPDSLWGYVTSKGRTRRLYHGGDYQLEAADTLAIYTVISDPGSGGGNAGGAAPVPGGYGQVAAPRFYFSRGLTGLIFPLTARYLREAYGTSNPAFVKTLSTLRFDQSLNDLDRKTGLFRVTTLYREAAGH